jgi:hypothetical protein
MNKIIAIGIVLFFLSGCSVTSEKYRYQWRFDKFYNLLSDEEKADFRNADYAKVGLSLDKRASGDKKLVAELKKVKEYEAITTFSGEQTAHFFREIILRELNRNNYYRFMKFLDSKAAVSFSKNENFMEVFNKLYQSDHAFKNFIDNMKTEYRLYGFSNEQVVQFFRNVTFPEATRKELYYLLKELKEGQALDDFKSGSLEASAKKLDDALKKLITMGMDFDNMKSRAGLSKLDTFSVLEIYSKVVMKEMDPYAVERTLLKF